MSMLVSVTPLSDFSKFTTSNNFKNVYFVYLKPDPEQKTGKVAIRTSYSFFLSSGLTFAVPLDIAKHKLR